MSNKTKKYSMSLSDNERQTIVRMEIEKAHKTFEDMEL